jgi:hypothetical protein
MASTYNSLGIQLMATGENAGTWGANTNNNLNFIKNTFGYIEVALTADRTLTIPDGSTGTYDGRAFIIKLTGSTGGSRVLDIAATAGDPAAAIEKPFLVIDSTTRGGSDTITFKVTGQTGIAIPKYGNVWCYHDGTDIRTSGMLSTRGSAGNAAAQPAYTLPAGDGSAGQLLQTDGSGSVSFATVSSGITTGKAIAMAMIFG